EGVTLRALLEQLRAAGLEIVSEAPIDRLRDARRSIEEVNIAGLALARVTIHQPQSTDPMSQLKTVAELQRAVAVIRAFAPLPRRVNPAVPTTGYEDIRRVALARIVADNVPSIQVDWSLYGPKLAQVALAAIRRPLRHPVGMRAAAAREGDRRRPHPLNRIPARRAVSDRAGSRDCVGRSRRIGGHLHEEADGRRALDRDGYELAHVGRAHARVVRAAVRDRAALRAARTRPGRHASALR